MGKSQLDAEEEEIILIGFFKETFELCKELGYRIKGAVMPDDVPDIDIGVALWKSDEAFIGQKQKYLNTKLVIVPDRPLIREKLFIRYGQEGFQFKNIISPLSFISETAHLGEGCFVQTGCHISANTVIGNGVRLNVNATVMHDCSIKAYASIAPGAVLLGGCQIGKCSYIGANATILPGIKVGDNTLIGAGSVVTRDVESHTVVMGNPAKYRENNDERR